MKTLPLYKKLQNEYKKYLICSFCVIMCISGIVSAQVSHSVSFKKSDFSSFTEKGRDNNNYHKITMKGLYQTSEVGNPELPVRHVKLIIPPDQDVANIIILDKKESELPGTYTVYPVQHPVPIDNDERPPFVKPNT